MIKQMIQIALTTMLSIGAVLGVNCRTVEAESQSIALEGRKYEFEEKSHYEISDAEKYTIIDAKKKVDGRVSIDGDLIPLTRINGVQAFGVNSGIVTFSYEAGNITKENKDSNWHIVEDKSKEVDGYKLSSAIKTGAIIVQTSLDGVTWAYDINMSDILNGKTTLSPFYKTKNIQLVSGSFYRITVVYETGRKVGEKKTLAWTSDVYEYKKYAEVFEFYLKDMHSADMISDSTVMMTLGTKTRTEKNDGYYGSKAIDVKDPHYGWDLGHFFVSGYTEDTFDRDGDYVFLKNVGDQVTLWFNLEQDIDKLNGNERLVINADTKGYDRDFEVPKTNFGRGTLIIRKTDYHNLTGKAYQVIRFLVT